MTTYLTVGLKSYELVVYHEFTHDGLKFWRLSLLDCDTLCGKDLDATRYPTKRAAIEEGVKRFGIKARRIHG